MECGFDRWDGDHATHDVGYRQFQSRECHQLAHRVPIVVA